MTPKEKAEELINKYSTYVVMWAGGIEVTVENVKQCALIAVDEILEAIDWHSYESPNKEIFFWEQVKNEIEKL